MKLTKKLEAEIRQVMDEYWGSYFKGDLEKWSHFLPDNYRNIGSTEEEIWNSKEEMLNYSKAVIHQMAGTVETRNKQVQIIPLDPYFMVHEFQDFYINTGKEWVFYAKFRLSSLIQKTDDGWKVLHQHGSVPDSKAQEGESIGFEKISKENLELREAVKRRTVELEQKNRELEIESSLERVRTVAMSMNKPDDMLDVCRIICEQLETLGTKEIRNVQTAIFHKDKGTYVNFEYYKLHDKSLITQVDYTQDPMTSTFASKMQNGAGVYFTESLTGKALTDWFEYQKTTVQFADFYLEEASSLNYYWFSLGAIALGISTYAPLKEEEINLFKRFRNVFELSYRRFLDIQKAEAQAQEARIETALERIRSRSLGMHHSVEIKDVVSILFEKLKELGLVFDGGAAIHLFTEGSKDAVIWVASPDLSQSTCVNLPYDENAFKNNPIITDVWNAKETGASIYNKSYSFEEKNRYFAYVFKHNDLITVPESAKKVILHADSYTASFISKKNSMLGANSWTGQLLSVHDFEVLERIANVFEQAYIRFLDLKKAEAQTRESQIQLALERVRARAMAMHSADELIEVANVLREQMGLLGQPELETMAVHLYKEDSEYFDSWYAFRAGEDPADKIFKGTAVFKRDSCQVIREFIKNYYTGKKEYTVEVDGAKREEWFKVLVKAAPAVMESVHERFDNVPEKTYFHFTDFSGGSLLMVSYQPPSEEGCDLQRRATGVFDLAYRRFLDLQKAEGQAKEAQIEVALERVRSRTMAMQRSEELKEVIQVVYDQFVHLNIHIEHTGFVMDYKARDDYNIWIADHHGVPSQVTIPYFDSVYYNRFNEAKEKGMDFFATYLTFEEKNTFYQTLFEYVPGLPEEAKEFYFSCPGLAASTVLLENVCLYIENFSGISYSDEENATLMRFGNVFQQTYTRFLDLQKAEAQGRESQIELGLERVRAKAMAMQRSDELRECVLVIYEQLQHLDFDSNACNIIIIDKESGDTHYWVSGFTQKIFPEGYQVPYLHHPYHENLLSAFRKNEKYVVMEYSGKMKQSFDEIFFTQTDFRNVPEQAKQFMIGLETVKLSTAFFTYGALQVLGPEALSGDKAGILQRFGNVFEQTYTRFLDLQKAEAQAREAKIEAALEKVRARTMGMQHSDELKEAASLLFQQVISLGIPAFTCGYNIWEKHEKECSTWMSDLNGTINPAVKIPLTEDSNFIRFYDSRQKGEDFYVIEMNGEEMQEHYRYLRKIPEVNQAFNDLQKDGISLSETQAHHVVNFSEGNLIFITSEPCPDAYDIFKRFGKVFEQTYTRFLDLQKAEAQSREAQIELGLERVRARAMAMQRSDELKALIGTVFTELTRLDLVINRCVIMIYDPATNDSTWWMANSEASSDPIGLVVQYHEYPTYLAYLKAWKEKTLKWEYVLEGKIKSDWDDFLFTETGLKALPDFVIAGMKAADKAYLNSSFNGFGNLTVATLEPLSDEHFNIMLRFAKVFDLTYTRFNDLQKAEGQAREATIEAALEKVRSRTMAMHHSNELLNVITELGEQFRHLGFNLDTANFNTNYRSIDWDLWMYTNNSNPTLIHIPQFDHPIFNKITTALDKGLDFIADTLNWEEKNSFNEHLFENTILRHVSEAAKQDLVKRKGFAWSVAFSKNTSVTIGNYDGVPYTDEQNAILRRFANVFEQTYTRFLDLQKAEAQAKEAKIEAALERVRGKAMAMHNSQDLTATIGVFYRELQIFSITPRRCGVGLLNKETRIAELSTMNTTEEGDSLEIVGVLKMQDHPVLERVYDNWLLQKEYHPVLRGNEIREYYQLLRPQIAFPDYPNDAIQYGYFFFFDEGGVYAWTEKEMNDDELQIYRRFTSVLSLTYKRYIDLKQVESNAKEAVKQAALDRIRAEIASMRTISDLDKITPLIWNELTILGIPFIRCGVFIMDDSYQLIHTFLSTPDGKALAAFHLPYTTSGNMSQVLNHWHDKKNYIDHWDKSAFTEFANILVMKGDLASAEQYMKTIPHDGFYLHFLPFLQGMLYVGNITQLGEEDIKSIQSVADAFSTAYARYEDFNKLEVAKEQVDSALNELQITQKQLVHSEKMASLGELTAGIAHEIQNPLNFVNNFSEVSTELVAEMNEEIKKGNLEDAAVIAHDLKKNLEKINHHGKRAGDIVKGMLQHSRSGAATKEPTDINKLTDEYVRLAYHGMRAKDKTFNITLQTDFDEEIGNISIVPQDIGRVVLNLITNASYVVTEKKKLGIEGYEPTVSISTKKKEEIISIAVKDNGNGIPQKVFDKIFQPFFTTKPAGQGTGLGLSLAYDIVKAHGGELKVETMEGQGSTFSIQLPV